VSLDLSMYCLAALRPLLRPTGLDRSGRSAAGTAERRPVAPTRFGEMAGDPTGLARILSICRKMTVVLLLRFVLSCANSVASRPERAPRPWFQKPALCSPLAERRWLNQKYPGWEDSWGVLWDEIIKNINNGEKEKTLPDSLPALCNLTQLPIGTHWDRHHIECFKSEYNGRTYHFDSDVSKWCFGLEPVRYAGHLNVVDRFIEGLIQPANLAGALQWTASFATSPNSIDRVTSPRPPTFCRPV
jgi:YHS domain-containing protein